MAFGMDMGPESVVNIKVIGVGGEMCIRDSLYGAH